MFLKLHTKRFFSQSTYHSTTRGIFIGILIGVLISFNLKPIIQNYQKETTLARSYNEDYETLVELLNFNSLREALPTSIEARKASKIASQIYARSNPNSLIAQYESLDKNCASRPFKPYFISALERFQISSRLQRSYEKGIRKNGTLLLFHESSGHIDELKEALNFVLKNHVVKVVYHLSPDEDTTRQFHQLIKKFISTASSKNVKVKLIRPETAILDLKLARKAKLMLVHGDAAAALAAFIAGGLVYFSNTLNGFAEQDRYRWAISDLQPINRSMWKENRPFHYRFDEMGTVMSSCCSFSAFGDGDDQKVICTNGQSFQKEVSGSNSAVDNAKPPCWILSLGCGNKFSFDLAIVRQTNCVMELFDCTRDFHLPKQLGSRVRLHKLCLGVTGDSRSNYRTLTELIALGSKSSGVGGQKPPALVKMDVEGWEHPVLHELLDNEEDSSLPEQMVIEIHAQMKSDSWVHYLKMTTVSNRFGNPSIKALFEKLSQRGYILIHRADNYRCPGCTEVNVIRQVALPDV